LDPATGIGIGAAVASLLVAMVMEGGNPIAFMQPTAMLIVFGGTIGVMIASSGIRNVVGMAKLTIVSMTYRSRAIDKAAVVTTIAGMAEKARREGLLALEDEAEDVDDAFIRKGVALVVDGTDPELVKDILESDLDAMEARHAQQNGLFATAGGFAPTLGIIGTVMGLVHVLENLSNPTTIGPAISTAFIATFYGVASANLFYLPVGNKLKRISHDEIHARTMIIEGIVSIQAGDNPRVVEEKLKTFLDPVERASLQEQREAPPQGGLARAA
jgi:chemotaxis protein MotA